MKRVKSITVVLMAVAMILTVSPVVCAEDGEKININTAPLEELMKLDKIGPKYAQRERATFQNTGRDHEG
jgi:DNA uptake protein ComE-like DNA-binding protein